MLLPSGPIPPAPGGSVAYAVTRGDEPQVFIASSPEVLSRVLATTIVARAEAESVAPETLDDIRSALLDERWDDAVVAWMDVTGEVIDVYCDEIIWNEARLDAERASFEIRMAPIFNES